MYKGRAGAALALLRCVELRGVGDDDAEAKRLLESASSLAEAASSHYEAVHKDPTPLRLTFLEGAAGAFAIRAATRAALGHATAAKESCLSVLALAPWVLAMDDDECELLYGRAGYLQAISFVRARASSLGVDATFGTEEVVSVARQILESGLKRATADLPLKFAWKGKCYLGAAHGTAGILRQLAKVRPEELEAAATDLPVAEAGAADASDLVHRAMQATSAAFQHASGNYPASAEKSVLPFIFSTTAAPCFSCLSGQA